MDGSFHEWLEERGPRGCLMHMVVEANGTAERDAALVMLEQIPGTKQVTVGGDKA
jgi:hypothetical protein